MPEPVNVDRLRELANAAYRWRQPDEADSDVVPWAPTEEWLDHCLLPEPDVELAAACSPDVILALLDANERASDLKEILRRTVKYGQAWLDANPDNERFRRRQVQKMVETAASALERSEAS